MGYHIVLSRPFDLASISQEARLDKRPRHTMWELSQQLSASIHQPEKNPISPFDKICAKLVGDPEHWALGRVLASQLTDNDVVFCAGEDVGFPLAILCKLMGKHPKLAVTVMAPDRARVRGVMTLFGLTQQIDLFLTNTQIKANLLRQHWQLENQRVYIFPEQTDVNFFTPGAFSADKLRPLVASAGLEQRDYKTLATATQDLAIDVKICAVSPNASASTRTAFPDTRPSNMVMQHYDWPELRQLYRDADVVVISLLDNHYSAGLTVLMEAMACRRPVVMTRTPGLAEQLIDRGVVMGVKPGDADGMKHAITELLNHPQKADELAQRGYETLMQEHTSELYVDRLAAELKKLNETPIDLEPSRPPRFRLRRA